MTNNGNKILEIIQSIDAWTCGTTLSIDDYNKIVGAWDSIHKDILSRVENVEPELKISNDGLSLEINDSIYTLSTPWDISSASAAIIKAGGWNEEDEHKAERYNNAMKVVK